MASRKSKEGLAQDRKAMSEVARELAAIRTMRLPQLRVRYRELFGGETKSKNLPFLRKKLAWRVQELVEGGLFPDTQALIAELAPRALVQKRAKPTFEKGRGAASPDARSAAPSSARDPRLPAVGTVLSREYQGTLHEVEVQADGFLHRGKTYRTLSALAKAITGTAWNGFLFFGLIARKPVDGN